MKHQKLLRSTTQVLCSTLVIIIIASQVRSVSAANGIQKTITFQGKVTNASGTNVTDGTYDFSIKLYDGAGSSATTLFTENWTASSLWSSTMSSAPSSGGQSLTYSSDTNEGTIKVGQILWNTTKQESVIVTSVNTSTNVIGISPTRQAWNTSDTVTNKVYVKDGVFKVAINSLNQDLSGVNFNTDSIFMGVEFNNDGEMKPRIQYTATPYAFNAEKVNGLTVVNTSGNPFTSTTTLKIGDGKTVQIDNGLHFVGTDGTQITFPNANDTAVVLDLAQTLTNKTIGSTGLVFSGATTDITTGTNEDLVITPNGTGRIGLGTTNPLGWLDLRSPHGTIPAASVSALTSFATFLVDQAGSGDIFAASSSGLARFSVSNGGVLRLANGASIDNSTQDTIVLAANAQNSGGVLRLPIKTTTGDPSLNSAGNIYYNTADSKFRCYQGTGWQDCIPSVNFQSTNSSSPVTLTASEQSLLSGSITPSSTTGKIWINATAELKGDSNSGRTVTIRIRRTSCTTGTQVGVDQNLTLPSSGQSYTAAVNYVDTPGTTSSTTYVLCGVTSAGSPTVQGRGMTLYEPTGSAASTGLGSLTVRQSDTASSVTGVSNLEFGPDTTSTDEFIVTDQTGGVARVRIGNQVGMLNQNESVTGAWNFMGNTVGIGTTSPNAKLEISSNLGTNPIASFSGTTTSAGLIVDNSGLGDLFTASSSGLPRFTITNGGGILLGTSLGTSSQCLKGGTTASWGSCGSATGTSYFQLAPLGGAISPIIDNYDVLVGSTATSSALIRLAGTSGQNSFIKTGGNLGIGTTSPNANLQLLGNFGTGATASISARSSFAGLLVDNTVGDLFSASSSGLNRFVITQNGNVGVGTTSPGALFDITKNTGGAVSELLRLSFSNAVNAGGYIDFKALGGLDFGRITGAMDSAGSGGTLQFTTAINNVMTEIMRISNTGNVGIGTTAPLAKLQLVADGTSPIASISANSSFAGLVVDNKGKGDLFTASSSGLPRFVITQNGNVGIGASSPTSLFQVNLVGSGTGLNFNATGTSPAVDINSNVGTGVRLYAGTDYTAGPAFQVWDSSSTFKGMFFDAGTTTGADIFFRPCPNSCQSGASVMTIKQTTGFVGIGGGNSNGGNRNPLTTLDIRPSTGTGAVASISGATSFAGLVIDNSGTGDVLTASSSGLTRFVVTQNGNMGLGLSNPTAAKFVISDSSQAAGVDMARISATTGTSTTGVDGLQIDFANAGSSAITNSGLTINVTSNNTSASSILYGLNIGNLTNGGQSSNETALNIGTGWDKGIVIGSGGSTNSGLVYTGAGRPTKTITLSAEYAGAILTASGSATTNGSMTSDASPSAALSNYETYYQWTSSQTSLQDYTVAVRVTLPADFSAWATSNALQVSYNTALTTIDTNKLDVFVYNADTSLSAQNQATPVAYYQGNRSATAKTWKTLSIDQSDLTDGGNPVNAAGKTMVIYLKMYAKDNNYVQVGDIVLNYLAAF